MLIMTFLTVNIFFCLYIVFGYLHALLAGYRTYGTELSPGGSILPATRWTARTSTLQHLRVFHMTSSTLSPCAHTPPLLPSLSPISLSLLPLISGYIPSHGEDHRVLRQRQADIPRRAHGLKGRLGPGSGLYQSIAALSRFQSIVGHRSI